MSKLTSLIRRAPKRTSGIVAMIALAVIVPVAALAWGPSRETFTIEKPSDHVAFNSITNNPTIGDERNFVGIRETTAANTWYDNMTVQKGKEYTVRMYVHNNAAANLNLVAQNVTAKFNLPTTTGKSVQVNGFLNASNVGADTKGNAGKYAEVYDHATFNSTTNFNLAYVSGSLKYENNAFGAAGTPLSESIFTSAGTKLGYDKLDGKIPGCFQYDGYVTFKVKPQFEETTNFSLTKMVSKHGEAKWSESYAAQPGEVVDFILAYKNTGEVQHNDVTFRDTLPTGLSAVANSNTWSNASKQNIPVTTSNLTNGTGINVGSYAKGANAYTVFSAKVAEKEQLKCGVNTFVNKGKVNTGGYAVEDTATVTVNKDCTPPPVKKITVCELATKKIVTINEADFDAKKYSKNLDDCKTVPPVKITVCELATKKIISIDEKDFDAKKHSKNLDDCKTVPPVKIVVCELATKQIITIDEKNFDAKKHSKDLNDCKTVPPVKIVVCELATKKIVTIDEKDFDAKKHSKNLDDCKTPEKIIVCELATKKIVTINESDFDAKKHSKNLDDCKTVPPVQITVCEIATKKIITIDEKNFDATKHSKDLNDCKTVPPVQITVCEIATKKIVTINKSDFNETQYTTDLTKCEETPVTPPELPHTGMGENIVAMLGLGSLVAGVAYYIASRRALGL